MNTNGKLFKFYKEVINDSYFNKLGMFDHSVVRTIINNADKLPVDKRQKLDPILSVIVSLTILGKTFSISN